MVEDVQKILSADIQEILKSPELSKMLLKCYSVLYLNSNPPRFCEKSQRQYYNQLKINGIMRAKETNKKKTCVALWKGLRWVSSMRVHLNAATINDEQAIKALVGGHLTDSDFDVLPEDYKKKVIKSKKKSTSINKKNSSEENDKKAE